MSKPSPKTILYRITDHSNSVVFAEEDRAKFVSRIWSAISRSKTWGDFRQAMPEEEYAEIIDQGYTDIGEDPPADSDEFSGDMLPGFSDGDYPPWLQPEMDYYLPTEVLSKYGKSEATFISGNFWEIPAENLEGVLAELRARGWEVQPAGKVFFY